MKEEGPKTIVHNVYFKLQITCSTKQTYIVTGRNKSKIQATDMKYFRYTEKETGSGRIKNEI
jgi:hypothetical protein